MSELNMTRRQEETIDALYAEIEGMICELVGEDRWMRDDVNQAEIRGRIADLIQDGVHMTEEEQYKFYPWLIDDECVFCGEQTEQDDALLSISLDFDDPRNRFCPSCGQHYDAVTVYETNQCPACNGSGKVDPNAVLGGREVEDAGVCPICKGRGVVSPGETSPIKTETASLATKLLQKNRRSNIGI